MRKHNGMRPQDIVVLLKMVSMEGTPLISGLAQSLGLSISEIAESLNRSRIARLLDQSKKKVLRQNLMEFLSHGVRYVFPAEPGPVVRGIPTAHSHVSVIETISSDEKYVWPSAKGEVFGQQIDLFYPKQVSAVEQDPILYQLLAMTDILRVGKQREKKIALEILSQNLLHESAENSSR